MSEIEKAEFGIWLQRKKHVKKSVVIKYITTLKSMTRSGALQRANDYLKDTKRDQSETTFLRKYWVMKYWAEYTEKEETIHEIERFKLGGTEK